ncbi:hypothetical protein [Sphingopyxis panaciterrae]
MANEPGHRLIEALEMLEAAARFAVQSPDHLGVASNWRLSGETWQAEVIVDPLRWLGLTFDAVDPATARKVHYAIDTDLYDISRPEQREFADEIESDIIEFLDNLTEGRMLRGEQTSDAVLVFPSAGSFVRVVAKRFSTTASRHDRESEALAGGSYAPVS